MKNFIRNHKLQIFVISGFVLYIFSLTISVVMSYLDESHAQAWKITGFILFYSLFVIIGILILILTIAGLYYFMKYYKNRKIKFKELSNLYDTYDNKFKIFYNKENIIHSSEQCRCKYCEIYRHEILKRFQSKKILDNPNIDLLSPDIVVFTKNKSDSTIQMEAGYRLNAEIYKAKTKKYRNAVVKIDQYYMLENMNMIIKLKNVKCEDMNFVPINNEFRKESFKEKFFSLSLGTTPFILFIIYELFTDYIIGLLLFFSYLILLGILYSVAFIIEKNKYLQIHCAYNELLYVHNKLKKINEIMKNPEELNDYNYEFYEDYTDDDFFNEESKTSENLLDQLINDKNQALKENGFIYKVIKKALSELNESDIDNTLNKMVNDYEYIYTYVKFHKNIK